MARASSERAVIWVLALVQFVNVLDFMMVMPLGPDFARALGIKVAHLGFIGGSYTAAAAVAGILGALFLDRFDRRRALWVALIGLAFGTALGAAATGLWTLLLARIVAGAFGGPAAALTLSIVSDVIPPERRGRAMGTVMSVFSVASVLGLPAGLELARVGGFRAPFVAVALLGLGTALAARLVLPPLCGHLAAGPPSAAVAGMLGLLRDRGVLLSLALAVPAMGGMFMLIPNLSAYVQMNLGYPRAQLGILYLAGGLAAFVAMRVAGPLVDHAGAFVIGTLATVALLAVLLFGFIDYNPAIPVASLFVGLMAVNSLRGVAFATVTSKVPAPQIRARFMSLLSAAQHLSAAAGAFAGAQLLSEKASGELVGIPMVAIVAGGIALGMVPLLGLLEGHLARVVSVPAPGVAHDSLVG